MISDIVPSATPQQLAVWIVCAAAVLVIINQGMRFFANFREVPPPLQTYMAKDDCRKNHEQLARELSTREIEAREIRHEMQASLSAINKDAEERSRRIHQRIDQMTLSINERFDDVPGKVIELLNRTGAIK